MSSGGVLSVLGSVFLHSESERTPMHTGSLSVFDATGWRGRSGRLRTRALRRHIESRITVIPKLRQHPVWPSSGIERPRWVDDLAFDIKRHVLFKQLLSPVDDHRLFEEVEVLLSGTLDRAHPLWAMWFIDGLSEGHVAVIEKVHHALADGIGGVDIAVAILDPSAEYQRDPIEFRSIEKRPPRPSFVGSRAIDALNLPIDIGHRLWAIGAHPLRAAVRAERLGIATGSILQEPLAPRCSLNATIASDRVYRVLRLSFDTVHDTATTLGGTVNDVLLSAVSYGLDGLFGSRDEDLGGAKIHVLVPVSVRGEDEHQSLDNRVTAMIVLLPTGRSTVEERFEATKEAVHAAWRHHHAELASTLLTVAGYWPERVIAELSGLIHVQPFVNLVVSDVPGPSQPLYLMGSRLLEVFPVVPLARNLTVSIGMLSYDGHLTVGLWADREHFADIEVLVDGLEKGFVALSELARRQKSVLP